MSSRIPSNWDSSRKVSHSKTRAQIPSIKIILAGLSGWLIYLDPSERGLGVSLILSPFIFQHSSEWEVDTRSLCPSGLMRICEIASEARPSSTGGLASNFPDPELIICLTMNLLEMSVLASKLPLAFQSMSKIETSLT